MCLTAVGVALVGMSDAAFRDSLEENTPDAAVRWSYDEFETGGELRDGKGAQIKMGKDSEPLRSGKGRALNVKVAQTWSRQQASVRVVWYC